MNSHDDSMDYSFEFREAARKSSKLESNPVKKPGKKLSQKTSSEKNLLSESAVSSPLKSFNGTAAKKNTQSKKNDSQKERDSKRFKQLTMTQALGCLNETSCSGKAHKSESQKSILSHFNVKEEPILVVI